MLWASAFLYSINAAQVQDGLFAKDDNVYMGFMPDDEKEREAIAFVKTFVEKIIKKQSFSLAEERSFFGYYGGPLGESLYMSLGLGRIDERKTDYFSVPKFVRKSPIGTLLAEKLYPILHGKKYFHYCLGGKSYNYEDNKIFRAGFAQNYILFLRITDSMAYWNNGVTLIFPLRYANRNKKTFNIALENTLIGNESLYRFLGFEGSFVSDFKLSEKALEKFKSIYFKLTDAAGEIKR